MYITFSPSLPLLLFLHTWLLPLNEPSAFHSMERTDEEPSTDEEWPIKKKRRNFIALRLCLSNWIAFMSDTDILLILLDLCSDQNVHFNCNVWFDTESIKRILKMMPVYCLWKHTSYYIYWVWFIWSLLLNISVDEIPSNRNRPISYWRVEVEGLGQ